MINNIKKLYNELLENENSIKEMHKTYYKTYEEYLIYDDKIQSIYSNIKNLVKNLYLEIEKNIDNFVKTRYECGIVFTKFEQDIKKGKFIIWIDKGYSIDHKFFNIETLEVI